MVSKGQLREWIARDEAGDVHDALDVFGNYFMIVTDPYKNDVGLTVVDFLEDGSIYKEFDVDNIDYWSLIVNE